MPSSWSSLARGPSTHAAVLRYAGAYLAFLRDTIMDRTFIYVAFAFVLLCGLYLLLLDIVFKEEADDEKEHYEAEHGAPRSLPFFE